ncbi:MAG: molecular chaperone DnaK [Bacteroidetes bacterium]|nr:MAG: molecular chaperone DnaK [Bacteroidota bacterium]PTM09547.1 MAG: molecular chaperone DnaK [Bacteroidota bacterium]
MKLKIFSTLATVLFFAAVFMSADHIDAPKVTNSSQDIADFFVFQGANQNNLVFATTVQGLLSPGTTAAATFDENTLIEFNIDTDGDNVEDLVIQAIPRDGKMIVFGPVAPSMKGTESSILSAATRTETEITLYGETAKTGSNNGISVFAGPRDDPFFFDLGAYSAIIGGNASSFANPGTDTFAGTNVLAVVVEVPKSLLGNATALNTWVETKLKR